MIVIKIFFILLLLIPIGLLMRYLLVRLAAETPAQTESDVPVDRKMRGAASSSAGREGKSTRKKTGSRKSRTRSNDGPAKKDTGSAGSGGSSNRAGRSNKGGSSYTPRQPQKWQRSERVPFGDNPYDSSGRKKPSDAARERQQAAERRGDAQGDSQEAAVAFGKDKPKRKKNRSEKSPSKRQLRKNRERARKRDLNKRRTERDARGRDL